MKIYSGFELVKLFNRSFFRRNGLLLIILVSTLSVFSCSGITDNIISIPIPEELVTIIKVESPLINNSISVKFLNNAETEHFYDFEESIGGALNAALDYSSIFGKSIEKSYEVAVSVKEWNLPISDPGLYKCQLKTKYVLYNEQKQVVFEKEILTEAQSDVAYFANYKRSRRAATLNVAKNVNQFMTALVEKLGSRSEVVVEKQPEIVSDEPKNLSLADELKKLSELHSSGALTDEEYKKAKDKLLNN